MLDHDGYDFIERVRALPACDGGKTPAVALTAFARSSDRTKALLAGFNAHVTEPVDAALRGSSSTVGATIMASVCAELEQRSGPAEDTDTVLARLHAELLRVE
jgi:CheY-like chemotaxis protein